MIRVVRLDFDHDTRDKSVRFGRFCDAITGRLNAPLIVERPVFSYGRSGRAQLDFLLKTVGTRDAIVFLSEICCYSFALVQTNQGTIHPGLPEIAAYESMESFIQSPTVIGHAVSADSGLALLDRDCTVLSRMPSPYGSEIVNEDFRPNPAVVDVIASSESDGTFVYAFRILDHARFFASVPDFDWPLYAITASDVDVDLGQALARYHKESLTDCLLSLSLPFGTLNDNHQDDYYAVSYRKPIWNCDVESLTFAA